MFRSAFAAVAAMAVALTMVLAPANAQPRRIQLGTLTCAMSSSIGLIVGSQKNVNCVFRGQPGEPEEAYTGTMTTLGLDIGITTGGVIVWPVFADTSRYAGMLAGRYTGATAEVSVAAGLGANVLVGGSSRTVALQPLSLQGQVGLDVAAGSWSTRSPSRAIIYAAAPPVRVLIAKFGKQLEAPSPCELRGKRT